MMLPTQRARICQLLHTEHGRRSAASSELGVHQRVLPDRG